MKTQQQVEKEEQQRIKNLVLNYDLQQSEDQDGICNRWHLVGFNSTDTFASGIERSTALNNNRVDRLNKDRSQRVRKLQLSDVDW